MPLNMKTEGSGTGSALTRKAISELSSTQGPPAKDNARVVPGTGGYVAWNQVMSVAVGSTTSASIQYCVPPVKMGCSVEFTVMIDPWVTIGCTTLVSINVSICPPGTPALSLKRLTVIAFGPFS